jgi:hypothetical protein
MFHNLAYSDPNGKSWLAQRGLNESTTSVTDTGKTYRDEGYGVRILLIYRWSVSGDSFEAQINRLSDNERVVNQGMKVNKPV